MGQQGTTSIGQGQRKVTGTEIGKRGAPPPMTLPPQPVLGSISPVDQQMRQQQMADPLAGLTPAQRQQVIQAAMNGLRGSI